MASGFKTAVLGLDAKQVDETIARMKREHEEILAEKDERFMDLRDRCNKLQEQLDRYQRQERSIASAVIDAHNKAAEILASAQREAQAERERAQARIDELLSEERGLKERLEANIQQERRDLDARWGRIHGEGDAASAPRIVPQAKATQEEVQPLGA